MENEKLKASRYNEGKPEISQIPVETLTEIARVFTFGAKKYSKNNWRKGFKYTSICDSLLRHYIAFMGGEDYDRETGLLHTAHMGANVMFLIWYQLHEEAGVDDRWATEQKKSLKNKDV